MSLEYDESFAAPSVRKSTKPSALIIYFANHLHAVISSCGRLTRTPLATLMTLIVIGVALALPTGLFVLLQNIKTVSQGLNDSSQISLYLKMDVPANQIQNLMQRLRQQPDITAVKYISPQQGLAEFKLQTDFQNALSQLKENPLPPVVLVQPDSAFASPAPLNQLLQNLKKLPEVDVAQFDMQWIKRLYAIIDLSKRIVYAIGTLLGLGVLFIIGNTIHLTLQKYRREIEVFKLVGATDTFIRRPFLYTGMLYGLLGSLVAWFLVSILLWWLATPVKSLAALYGSHFLLQNLSLSSSLILIAIGIILGLIGAWLAVGKHLRSI